MKKTATILCLFAFCLMAVAQLFPTNKPARILLVWDPNPEPDIAGYKVYYGVEERVYDVVVDVPCVVSNNLTVSHTTNWIGSNFVRGLTYHFAATAYNVASLESDFSEEAVLTLGLPPSPPQELRVTNGVAVLELKARLEGAKEVTGPWTLVYDYPINYFDPTNHGKFYRIAMDFRWLR